MPAPSLRHDGDDRVLRTCLAAAVVFLLALAILCTIAGWDSVVDRLRGTEPEWLAPALAAQVVAFVGYVFAYRGLAAANGGIRLGLREASELVAVGFGAFLAKGGGALDAEVLAEEKDGEVRVIALDALEHAPLAPAACAASIALLVEGKRTPGLDFTVPWATLVPLGALIAWWAVRRRERYHGRLRQVLDGIHILFAMAGDLRENWAAFAGSAVYWAGDVLCLWASLRIFHAEPAFAAVVLAHAVGYVLTRRTLPLAGAGVVELLMPLVLVACGAPFSGAILAVAVYRIFNLWLPLGPALVALPAVRARFGDPPAGASLTEVPIHERG